jgi:hypothetical protein
MTKNKRPARPRMGGRVLRGLAHLLGNGVVVDYLYSASASRDEVSLTGAQLEDASAALSWVRGMMRWYRRAHPEPALATWDRFDICEAHYLYARHYERGGDTRRRDFTRLHRLGFKPGASLVVHDEPGQALTENGEAIYHLLVARKED